MMDTPELPLVDVGALRVGMFVHLDLSWLSHPFALSSFRIASAQQISVLRELGLEKLRWSPQHSDIEDPRRGASERAEAGAAPDDAARCLRRERLAAERVALAECEHQFSEATRECSGLIRLVPRQPVAAGRRAHALARTLVDKMTASQDLCIRLLPDTAGDQISNHAVNVGVLSLLLGHALGWPRRDMLDMGTGALLHDIGEIDLPQRVRDRAGCLCAADIRLHEEHVNKGVAMGRAMGLSHEALRVIGEHHEMADGSGFPAAICNDHMSVAACIVALADRYDTLCNPSVAARARTPHEALCYIFTHCENQHDTTMLSAFISMIGIYPAGSVVQLTDGRFAIVVAVNSSRSVAPRVLVYDPAVPRDEALFVDLHRKGSVGIRRAMRPQELSPDAFEYLQPRRRLAYHCEPACAREAGRTQL
ncbi:MAG TPA: HD domain-containing phosphohydrolase [Burkholderiaceae bacterium]|nr:HD domain-containing phosphohydrolase [Burkholderiaceae bacterium]